MRVLVHVCCGPCSITVLDWLLNAGHSPTAFFYNPNIQPLAEYIKRRQGAGEVAASFDVPILYGDMLAPEDQGLVFTPHGAAQGSHAALAADPDAAPVQSSSPENELQDSFLRSLPGAVNPVLWMRAMHEKEDRRCHLCWNMRLQKTAMVARSNRFEGITSSLLYSRYQNHQTIHTQGEAAAKEAGLLFIYHDFRQSWQEGITRSKALGIYRQQYCGCMYSEYARYSGLLKKAQQTG